MGKIVLIMTDRPAQPWKEFILKVDSKLQVDIWPDIQNATVYSTAVVWKHPAGILNRFENLKLVYSLGAGVDHVLSDPDLPRHVQIARIVDEQLTQSMSNFIILSVLRQQRRLQEYIANRNNHQWQKLSPTEQEIKVGFLGLGVLGKDAAVKLAHLDFEVHGFSQSSKDIRGVTTYCGEQGLEQMLKKVNVIVNLLPLTSETRGILDLSFFKKCQTGTYLVNVARGEHLVESDLIEALDEGLLSGAWLDVFQHEPLPEDHIFWNDSRIMITPHIASVTNPASAAAQIVDNHRRLEKGLPSLNIIDISKEY